MDQPTYHDHIWHQISPTHFFCRPPSFDGFENLLRRIQNGITDYEAELSLHQTLLQNRIWGVNFAVDYIAKLEIRDGGWGRHTWEIVQKEQQVLPAMRNKVAFAAIRLQLCKNLLAQFELMCRLIFGARARFESRNAGDQEKMDRGMKLLDGEWKRMYEEHTILQNLKSNDDSEKAQIRFLYKFELYQPDGTLDVQIADASKGPIQLGEGMMGHRIGKPIIGLSGILMMLEPQTQPTHRARTPIRGSPGSTTSDDTGNGQVHTPSTPSKSDDTGNGEVNKPSTPSKKKKKRRKPSKRKKRTMPDLETLKQLVEHDPVPPSIKASVIDRATYTDGLLFNIHDQEEHGELRQTTRKRTLSTTLPNRRDDPSNCLNWARLQHAIEQYFGLWTTSWIVLQGQPQVGTAHEDTDNETIGHVCAGKNEDKIKKPRAELKPEPEFSLEEDHKVEQVASTQATNTGTATPSSFEGYQTIETEASTQTTNTGTVTPSEQPVEFVSDRRQAAITEMLTYSASLSRRIARLRPTPPLCLLLSRVPSDTCNFGSRLFIDDTLVPVFPKFRFKSRSCKATLSMAEYLNNVEYFGKDYKAHYWMWRRILSRAPRRYRRESCSLLGERTWGGRRDERLF